jgi:hypothetical protein
MSEGEPGSPDPVFAKPSPWQASPRTTPIYGFSLSPSRSGKAARRVYPLSGHGSHHHDRSDRWDPLSLCPHLSRSLRRWSKSMGLVT